MLFAFTFRFFQTQEKSHWKTEFLYASYDIFLKLLLSGLAKFLLQPSRLG